MKSNVWLRLVSRKIGKLYLYFSKDCRHLLDFYIFETSGNDLCFQVWNDYQLQWDEADYGGISVLRYHLCTKNLNQRS